MAKEDIDNQGESGGVDTTVKVYKPYFLPTEVAYLVQQTAGKLTPSRVEALRQVACGFMDRVGGRLGFPRRTTATAQLLYHRFHLFFPLKDFNPQDVSVGALLVASKLEDTLKKLREIQIAAHHVKIDQEGGSRVLSEPDPHLLDSDRPRLVGIERLILETISFNFNLRSNAAYAAMAGPSPSSMSRDAFSYVIKMSRHLGAGKEYARRAFQVAIDAHKTVIPLSYPPHAIAAASLLLPSYFNVEDILDQVPAFQDGWEDVVRCDIDDIEDICHGILDLYLSTGAASAALRTSPSENPAVFRSPKEMSSTSSVSLAASTSSTELTAIKIRLRNGAAKRQVEEGEGASHSTATGPRKRRRHRVAPLGTAALFLSPPSSSPQSASSSIGRPLDKDKNVLGRDDVTVRFLWDAQPGTVAS